MSKNGIYALNVTLPQWQRVMKERVSMTPNTTVDQAVAKILDELEELRMDVIKRATKEIIAERLEKIDKGEF